MRAAAILLAGVAAAQATTLINSCNADGDCRVHRDIGASCVSGRCNCTQQTGFYFNTTGQRVTLPLYIDDGVSNTCAPRFTEESVSRGELLVSPTVRAAQYVPRINFTARVTFSGNVACRDLGKSALRAEFEAALQAAVRDSEFHVAFDWCYPVPQLVLYGSVPRTWYAQMADLERRIEQVLRLGRRVEDAQSTWPLTFQHLDPFTVTNPTVGGQVVRQESFNMAVVVRSGHYPCQRIGATQTVQMTGERGGVDYTVCQAVQCASHLSVETTYWDPYPSRGCVGSSPGMSDREIAGLVIGILLGLVLLAIVLMFLCRSPQVPEKGEVEGDEEAKA